MPGLRSVGQFHPLAAVVMFVALPALTACARQHVSAHSAASLLPPATAVGCTDAPQLRQRALDDRRQSADLKSDQEKADTANRANFFASLATIAALKCKVTAVEADEALIRALDAAQKAAGRIPGQS
jgi:hypothetical protein